MSRDGDHGIAGIDPALLRPATGMSVDIGDHLQPLCTAEVPEARVTIGVKGDSSREAVRIKVVVEGDCGNPCEYSRGVGLAEEERATFPVPLAASPQLHHNVVPGAPSDHDLGQRHSGNSAARRSLWISAR